MFDLFEGMQRKWVPKGKNRDRPVEEQGWCNVLEMSPGELLMIDELAAGVDMDRVKAIMETLANYILEAHNFAWKGKPIESAEEFWKRMGASMWQDFVQFQKDPEGYYDEDERKNYVAPSSG